MRVSNLLTLATFTLAGAALVGCAPDTPYRYTAMTPAPRAIPWDGRGNRAGTLHLEGSITSSSLSLAEIPKVPEIHDSALHVATLAVDGAALIEPVKGVQVGVRGSYTAFGWTRETAIGTMPLPNKPSLFGFGPEVRIWLPVDRNERFALGIAAQVLHYDVPYAEWTRADCVGTTACVGTTTASSGSATYVLTHEGSSGHFIGNLGVYPSLGFGDHARYGNVFGVLALTQGFQNDGFTDTPSVDGKLSTYAVPILGAGYGFRYEWVRLAAGIQWAVSSSESPVQYGPSGWLTLGIDAPLWRGKKQIYTPKE